MSAIPDLAETIRTERARRRWSQSDLAQQAGVSTWTVSTIEDGTARPRIETVRRLLSALGLRLSISHSSPPNAAA